MKLSLVAPFLTLHATATVAESSPDSTFDFGRELNDHASSAKRMRVLDSKSSKFSKTVQLAEEVAEVVAVEIAEKLAFTISPKAGKTKTSKAESLILPKVSCRMIRSCQIHRILYSLTLTPYFAPYQPVCKGNTCSEGSITQVCEDGQHQTPQGFERGDEG